MNPPLYTIEVLRLAASLPEWQGLDQPYGAAELRSPTCGSRIRSEVRVDERGAITELTQQVHACAFGQASAALVAQHAAGRGRQQITAAAAQLERWLAGEDCDPGWPGFDALAPARAKRGRHGAILLPLRALAAALEAVGA